MPGPHPTNGHPVGGSAIYSGRSRIVPAQRSAGPPIVIDRLPGEEIRFAPRRPVGRIVARRWKLILLVVLACTAGSVAYVLIAPARYQSSVQILVTPAEPDTAVNGLRLIGGSEPTRVVQTAVALLDTHDVAVRTAQTLGDPYTPAAVEKAVTVAPRGQSYIVSVTAVARTPDAAALLADTFARSALDLRNADIKSQAGQIARSLTKSIAAAGAASDAQKAELARVNLLAATGDPTVSLAATASGATGRAGIPPPLTVLLAFVFGVVLGVALAMAWDAIRNRTAGDSPWG
jgi:capsular polysaccharide biosynthesis protein